MRAQIFDEIVIWFGTALVTACFLRIRQRMVLRLALSARLLSPAVAALQALLAAAPAWAQSTIILGEPKRLGLFDNGNANLLLAQGPYGLRQAATVQSLSFYVGHAAGQLILGIYTAGPNNDCRGGALVAETAPFTPGQAWNTQPVTQQALLPVGYYCLAYLPSSNNLSFRKGLASGINEINYPWNFAMSLPGSFAANPSGGDQYHWSFYATLLPSNVPPPPPPPPPPTGFIHATDFCPANGGGDGSAANPWHAACIQAALNSAVSGNTVYLAAGNWSLSGTPVVSSASDITLTGAGSGNTFDQYGHPNNGQGGPIGTYTRVATDTRYGSAAWLQFVNCQNVAVSHIYVDGSHTTAGGDERGTLNFRSCPDPYVAPRAPGPNIDDIRVLSFNDSSVSPETQFFVQFSNNATIQNSIFTASIDATNPNLYSAAQIFQSQEQTNQLIKNNLFYGFAANPFYMDNVTFTGNADVMRCDSTACPSLDPAVGYAACSYQGCGYQSPQPSGGNFHMFIFNNVFDATGFDIGVGGGVNDPTSGGVINDLKVVGNTVLGRQAAIDSCVWHVFGSCVPGVVGGVDGMKINGFTVTNNSIVASQNAILDGQGTGVLSDGQINTVTGMVAHQNYLSGPSRQYLHDQYTISPDMSNNFGMNVTSGFVQMPTVSFTLDALSNGVVRFAATGFTAQYGAVMWLASTLPTPPAPSDPRWNYLPPVSLAATSGATVYVWVMDSAGNVSLPASALVP
jgi:hypothetical protein